MDTKEGFTESPKDSVCPLHATMSNVSSYRIFIIFQMLWHVSKAATFAGSNSNFSTILFSLSTISESDIKDNPYTIPEQTKRILRKNKKVNIYKET